MADVIDPQDIFATIYNGYLSKNPDALYAVQQRNEPAMKSLLQLHKLDVTPENLDELFNLSQLFKTQAQQAAEQQAAEQQEKAASDKFKEDFSKNVDKIMQVDPTTRAIRNGAIAGSELAHAGAKMAENNGNRLAQALLAGRRHHSTRQDELYGPSYIDKASQMTAQNTMRRGENTSALLNMLGNTIGRIAGLDVQNDEERRQLKMSPYNAELGLPGDYWQTLGQREKRALSSYNK